MSEKELKILQRNFCLFDYLINEGYNPPSFEDCQFYLKRQSRLLKRLGVKIDSAFPPTDSWSLGSGDKLGYYDLIEEFDELMKRYDDEYYLRSIIWRSMPELTVDDKQYTIFLRFKYIE